MLSVFFLFYSLPVLHILILLLPVDPILRSHFAFPFYPYPIPFYTFHFSAYILYPLSFCSTSSVHSHSADAHSHSQSCSYLSLQGIIIFCLISLLFVLCLAFPFCPTCLVLDIPILPNFISTCLVLYIPTSFLPVCALHSHSALPLSYLSCAQHSHSALPYPAQLSRSALPHS